MILTSIITAAVVAKLRSSKSQGLRDQVAKLVKRAIPSKTDNPPR